MLSKADILVVDDSLANLKTLSTILQEEGYKVRPASNGTLAYEAAIATPPDLILLDIRMPDMDGYAVCQRFKAQESLRSIPIIFISALENPEDKVKAFTAGGQDYITKPFQVEEVKARVTTQLTLKRHYDQMQDRIVEATSEIAHLNQEIVDTQLELLFTVGEICEARSGETGQHVRRVGEYCQLLARLAGLTESEAALIMHASPLHDIGKVAVPDAILNKPGRLTDEERQVMQKHAAIGYQMLNVSSRPLISKAAVIAHEHHEKWDGSGYPRGLAGESISIEGRIAAIADVFDALMSKRCYKNAWELDDVMQFFSEQSVKHFDPDLVTLLFDNIDAFINISERFKD